MPQAELKSLQTIVRWPSPTPVHLPLWKEAGVDFVVSEEFSATMQQKASADGITLIQPAALPPISSGGIWPGIRRPASRDRDIEVASASREPWIDSNLYLTPYRRALSPGQMAITTYPAKEAPPYSLALALIEARLGGGNIVLEIPPDFRQALDEGKPAAKAAWTDFATTSAWLRRTFFIQPAFPTITAAIDPSAPTREIANLLFRRGVSPRLVSSIALPAPDPQILALVAVSLAQVPVEVFRHAEAGSVVIIDSPPPPQAKLTKQEPDRNFYTLGKGAVVAYHKRIADPSEFALDVIDIVTHKRRPCRLWNAPAAIATATVAANGQQAILRVLNYGAAQDEAEIQAHIQGHFSKAELLSPGRPPSRLQVARRSSSTEVFLTRLDRLAVVVFSR